MLSWERKIVPNHWCIWKFNFVVFRREDDLYVIWSFSKVKISCLWSPVWSDINPKFCDTMGSAYINVFGIFHPILGAFGAFPVISRHFSHVSIIWGSQLSLKRSLSIGKKTFWCSAASYSSRIFKAFRDQRTQCVLTRFKVGEIWKHVPTSTILINH